LKLIRTVKDTQTTITHARALLSGRAWSSWSAATSFWCNGRTMDRRCRGGPWPCTTVI